MIPKKGSSLSIEVFFATLWGFAAAFAQAETYSPAADGATITVTGTIKNYKGTIEFDKGCTLDAIVK